MPITKPPVIHAPVDILEVGDSFFLPVLSNWDARRLVLALADEQGYELELHYGIDTDTGMYGARVVRVT